MAETVDVDQHAWIDAAEHDVRTACLPQERVSEDAADYLDDELAESLRLLRLDISRLIKVLEAGTAHMFCVRSLSQRMRWHAEQFDRAAAEQDRAATEAVNDAIAKERDRRAQPEAWTTELEHRARIKRYLSGPLYANDDRRTSS